MRRLFTNEVVLLIAGLLLASAVVFAWLRSRVAPARTGGSATRPTTETGGGPGFDRVLGALTYDARCASCHAEGQGGGRLPPLHGHAADLFNAEGGRAYLVDFLLYGLERHPAYADQITDEQAAAVLNHTVTAWGNSELLHEHRPLFDAEDILEHRRRTLSPAQVRARRPQQVRDAAK